VKFEEQKLELNDGRTMAFLRIPSYFPRENRPFVYLPTADFSFKAATKETFEVMMRVIDSLLDKWANVKGLIHAISYDVARYIVRHTRHQNRVISHLDASTRIEALEQLIESEFPLVLVSPSFERGIDLHDDRARFQIIVKIPYMLTKDPQTRKRMNMGKMGARWYSMEAARAIVQMAGRIVRSASDHGATYILDTRWPDFYKKMERDFPAWFREVAAP